MGTVKFAISSVFRDTGQFNSNRPEQGEGGEKGKGRKVERERGEGTEKEVEMESERERERKKKKKQEQGGYRIKTEVPGEWHVVNKCLWNKDFKGV